MATERPDPPATADERTTLIIGPSYGPYTSPSPVEVSVGGQRRPDELGGHRRFPAAPSWSSRASITFGCRRPVSAPLIGRWPDDSTTEPG